MSGYNSDPWVYMYSSPLLLSLCYSPITAIIHFNSANTTCIFRNDPLVPPVNELKLQNPLLHLSTEVSERHQCLRSLVNAWKGYKELASHPIPRATSDRAILQSIYSNFNSWRMQANTRFAPSSPSIESAHG
jgi:hypothetical protein